MNDYAAITFTDRRSHYARRRILGVPLRELFEKVSDRFDQNSTPTRVRASQQGMDWIAGESIVGPDLNEDCLR